MASATIGGIAAANAQGPMRAIGGIRDWIIGMTVIHVDGRRSKTGGRVVKNVTGYDLAKLYTGSLGSLTVIAEISFKLKAQFPKTSTAIAEFQNLQEALAVLGGIRKSPLQPIACELSAVLAGERHLDSIRRASGRRGLADCTIAIGGLEVIEGDLEDAAWERLRLQHAKMGPMVVRVVGLPSETGTMIEQFHPVSWIAHAASGIVLMAFEMRTELVRFENGSRGN